MGLRVAECFVSIQGESTWAGLPFAFVRLAGCNLNCRYCDTRYARRGGRRQSLQELVAWVQGTGRRLVCVTGGEPLVQEQTPELCRLLTDLGFTVFVETNGSRDISVLAEPVVRILDVKTPSSNMAERNRWENLDVLRPGDEVKFVLTDRRDFDWSLDVVERWRLLDRVAVLFSAARPFLEPKILAKWILESGRDIRLQVQLHRVLWPDVDRGV